VQIGIIGLGVMRRNLSLTTTFRWQAMINNQS